MTAILSHDSILNTSAFVKGDSGVQVVMNCGAPCVEWSFRISELQQWLTTLEELMLREGNQHNRRDLEGIYFSLKAAYTKHIKQHDEIVTDAPTADDLFAYLVAYAKALGDNA